MDKCKRYIVRGVVQRVGYRFFTQRQCRKLGLRGWVRNLANGDVEVLACGDDSRLQSLLFELKSGPSFASVEHVHDEQVSPEQCGVLEDFATKSPREFTIFS